MKRMLVISSLLLITLLLTACGQSGRLYMPEKTPSAPSQHEATA